MLPGTSMKECNKCGSLENTFSENRKTCNVCRYRQRDYKKMMATKKEYRKNPEVRKKVNAANKAWRKNNLEAHKQMVKNHYQKNKHTYYVKSAERRALKKRAMPVWADKRAIDFVHFACSTLNKYYNGTWEVDHIIPLSSKRVCGLHNEFNLQLLTRAENRRKSNKFEGN